MRRREDRRQWTTLAWFILLSLLVHHAVLSFIRPPDTTVWRTQEVDLVDPQELEAELDPDDQLLDETDPDRILDPQEIVPDPELLARLASEIPEKKDRAEKPDEKKHEDKPEEPPPESKPDPEQLPKEVLTPKKIEGLHFVDVRSHETDEPPPDAKYFAPINSQVDEETKAQNTNMDVDDGKSTPSSEGEPDEQQGNSGQSLAAHVVEDDPQPVKDSPTTDHPEDPDLLDATPSPAASPAEPVEGSTAKQVPKSQQAMPAPELLSVDNAPSLQILKSADGEILDTKTGKPLVSFKEQKKLEKKKGGDAPGPEQKIADLDIGWTEAQGVIGAQMDEAKKTWKDAKKNKQKGGFTKNIDKVFSQLENFIPDVKPGNQTALNAAYHPYAEYLTAFHRNIHPHWGDGYLASLMSKPNGDPLNDMSLWNKLEFVVLSDGTLEKVTVVRNSGNLVYDVAAIDALYDGEPYPPPPEIIKSYDGKVYIRWGFYRNESQCGVWNAEPYILVAPKEKKKPKLPKEVQGGDGMGGGALEWNLP